MLYKVSPELCSQAGPFTSVTPETIKAQDGDMGINQPVVYSIITGTVSSSFYCWSSSISFSLRLIIKLWLKIEQCYQIHPYSKCSVKFFLIYFFIVTPNKYQPNFSVNQNTGIISVTTGLDREEIETITLQIQVRFRQRSHKTLIITQKSAKVRIPSLWDDEMLMKKRGRDTVLSEICKVEPRVFVT